MQSRHIVVIAVLAYLTGVNCKETVFVECDVAKASTEKSTECPVNSKCIELGQGTNISASYRGVCACKENFMVNKEYTSSNKSSVYCIESVVPTTSTTSTTTTAAPVHTNPTSTQGTSTTHSSTTLKPTPPTTSKPETSTKPSTEAPKNASDTNKQPEPQQKEENGNAPPSHHILGGIVLPVMIVLAFIGTVFAIRRYDLLERAQNYIRNRQAGRQAHQTRYDGLENDFDDDPLLI